MSVMQITGQLEQETGWSKQAVISFLKRMEAKGLVTYEQKGRTRYYLPIHSEEAVAKRERSTFLQNFYHGRLGLMISAMVQENALSQEDIQEIRKVLDAFQPREDGENI